MSDSGTIPTQHEWRGWPYVRSMHPYAFRSGEWAEILTTMPAHGDQPVVTSDDCYLVRWPDGATDLWLVFDPDGEYEYSNDPAVLA